MKREKSLIKNTFIITIGKICTQLITFFLLPLYTGILSTEEYGIVELLNTLVALLLPIITFQVEKALFRELIEVREAEHDKSVIISNSVFSVAIQCLSYLLFFFIISNYINNKYKYFLATNVIASIFSSLFLQMARGLGKNKEYAIGSFISALTTIIFNVLFLVVIKMGATGMLLGTLLGQLSCTIYSFFSLNLYKYINYRVVDKCVIKRLWAYSIPLIPSAISWWIFNASDRIIVSSILGLSSNGLLSASSKFSAVYITLYNIFDMSWTESVALHINDKDIEKYFNKVFNIMLKLMFSMAIGIIACMPFVYPILINKKFSAGFGLVPILVIASFLNAVVGLISVIYVAKKDTKTIANTSIFAAVCNIVTHLCLIKYIGLYAAAISTIVSFVVMTIYRLYNLNKKYFRIVIPKSTVVSALLIIIGLLTSYYIHNIYINIISLIIVIIYCWIINKKSFEFILDMLMNKVKNK